MTDQPASGAKPALCPTADLRDDDCEADCHEGHHVPWKRLHEPAECPSAKETTAVADTITKEQR